MPGVFRFITCSDRSRSMLLWPCSISWESGLKQLYILFCTGPAAIKHYLAKFAGKIPFFQLCIYILLFDLPVAACCSKCGRLLAMDQKSSWLLPPVCRPHQHFFPVKVSSTQPMPSTKDQEQAFNVLGAYHIGCFQDK
uniref:Uncharacterized protein MANES_08G033200 n=1 Tax=Rhizophora mucronata TaxID=61149 RepID=A0A2P2JLY3_RHIMU